MATAKIPFIGTRIPPEIEEGALAHMKITYPSFFHLIKPINKNKNYLFTQSVITTIMNRDVAKSAFPPGNSFNLPCPRIPDNLANFHQSGNRVQRLCRHVVRYFL